jgi:hypothetical protein
MFDTEIVSEVATNRCPKASENSSFFSSIEPLTAIAQARALHAYDFLRITLIYAAISLVAVGLYLLSPKPEGRHFCGQTVQLGRQLSFPLNCDSMEFIDDAISPSSLLKPGNERQERPLFVTAAAIPTQLLIQSRFWRIIPERVYHSFSTFPAFSAHYAKHHISTRWSDYAKYCFCAYIAYIALNGIIVVAALLLFNWLTITTWKPNGIVIAFASLLLANDVVKAFFWSPHTQMLNLVVPLGAVLVCDALLRVPIRSLGFMWTLGCAIGILTLTYGSFPVLVLAGMLGLAIRLFSKEIHISPLRFSTQSLALVTGLALPSVIWIALCHVVAGGYHNRELTLYHQFIWVWESAHLGWAQLLVASTSNLVQFLAVLLPVSYFPVLLLVGIVVVGIALRVPIGLVLHERSTTFIAIAVSTFVCLVYFYFLGTYRERLALNIVLPLLVAAAIFAIGVLKRAERTLAVVIVQSVWILTFARFVYEIGKAGPWSS